MKIGPRELIHFALQEQEHRDELELVAVRVHRKEESWVLCKVWWSSQGMEAGWEDRSLPLAYYRYRDRTRESAVEDRKKSEGGLPAPGRCGQRFPGGENSRYWRLIQRGGGGGMWITWYAAREILPHSREWRQRGELVLKAICYRPGHQLLSLKK